MTLTHNWTTGGSATITYNGNGNGSVVISSSRNEGVDRSFVLKLQDATKTKTVNVTVTQRGRREVFFDKNGAFYTKDGSEFLTLK